MKKRILAFALAMSMAFSLAMPAAAEAIEPDDSTSVDTELLLDQLEEELQGLPTESESDSSSEEVTEDPPAAREPDVLPEEPVPENTPAPTDDEQEGIPAEDEQPEATADPVETPEPTLLPESTAVPEVTEQPETATPETALDEYNADDDIALYIEHSDDQEYMRYLADYYLSNFPYDFYIKGGLKLPYREDVESKKDNKDWNNSITAWKILTLGEGTATLDYTDKKIGFYDTVIFDILYSTTHDESAFKKAEKLCKSTESGTFKKIFELTDKTIKPSDNLAGLSEEQKDTIGKFLSASKTFQNVCGAVGDITKVYKYCTKVEDLIDKCTRAEVVLGQMKDTAVVLRQMAEKTGNIGLKKSLQDMADMCDGTWSEADMMRFFAEETTEDILIKEGYKLLWKSVASACGNVGLTIQTSQAVGKSASNILFSTDAIFENYYSELSLYEIENLLREVTEDNANAYRSNSDYENARNLNVSVDLMMRLHKHGIEQSKKLIKVTLEDGSVNQVRLFFNSAQVEKSKSILDSINSTIDLMIRFYETDVYDMYIEECGEEIQEVTGNVPEELPCKKEEEPVKRQELKLEADLVSGKTVSSDWTLDKDEEVYADLKITDGAIDLNGHTLTVCGNVIQTGGKLRINGGRLEVGGDYRIQTKGTNDFGDTTWSGSYGTLVMDNSQDYILVNGTFATAGKESTLTAGTLEVKGNFEQHGTGSSSDYPNYSRNFNASGTHKVILTSEEEPRVYFESRYSKFQNLEIRNTNIINCDGSFLWVDGSLTAKDKKLAINSDVKLKTMDLAGQNLTVQGYLNKEDGTLLLNGGTITVKKDGNLNSGTTSLDNGLMKVEGSVIQANGQLRINGGRLEVGGDYRIQTKGTNDFGDTVWNGSYGTLVMDNSQDYILVNGTFATAGKESTLTAGTLEVKGDFEQHGTGSSSDYPNYSRNFNASGTHKVILTSEEEPRVYFESRYSKFQNLEIRNTNIINCDGSFLWVDGSLTAKDKKLAINSDVKLKTMDLAGQNLTVQGYLNKEDGTLLLNGGTITVKKDGNLNSGTTSLDNGLMKVEGSVIQANGQLRINGGRLEVGGDYRIQTKGTNDFGDTVWNGSYGTLVMDNSQDYILVNGTFATAGKESTLTAGTLEVKGDFEQHGTDSNSDYPNYSRNFKASGTHKVILSGEKTQTVYFDSNYGRFANLEVTNKEPLCLKGRFNIGSLQSDLTAKADGIKLYSVDLQGHTMNLTGDIYQTEGELKLQPNGVLNITGNLYQDNGTITMNQSTLKVSGSYRIQTKGKNSLGETVWNGSNGTLVMSKPEDYVLVGGTFATSGKGSTLTAGTLEVKGDFEQHGTDSNSDYPNYSRNFKASGTHKVILSGEKTQTVYFDSNYGRFANLEVTNKEPLCLKGRFNIGSLQSDLTAKADGIKLYSVDLQGHTMNLTGDIYQTEGELKLQPNGVLNITGNLYQDNGTITLNQSTIKVSGNYRIQVKEKNSLGETVWNGSNGILVMSKPEDYVLVGGTFATSGKISTLTAGTLEVKGDFEQHGTAYYGDPYSKQNFDASGTHKVILSGEKPQTVSFDSSDSGFANLEVTNKEPLYLKGVLNIGSSTGSLQSDVTAKADGIKLYDIDLQGHAMSLTGNVYQKGGNIKLRENGILNITGNFYQEDGTLTMNKSTVQVTGDYRIQISGKNELDETVWNTGYGSIIMTKAEDHIIVGGTFATSGNESKLTAGTMEIAGDFEQHSNRTDRSFSASGTHKVILNGEGKQNISFDSRNSKFNILELTQARKNYIFEPDECWNTLIEDPVPGPETSPCGTNAKWSLEDGVLTISGRGAIDDYGKAASQPWYASRALITSIVVEEGVTAIGNFNFYGLTNLENVTLARSVTDIGDYAFKNCSGIKELTLPTKLVHIGESAFYGCTGLSQIELPNSLASTGTYVFKNCTGLESAKLSSGMSRVSESLFYGCTKLTNVTIPEGIKTIDGYAFKNCTNLAGAKLPSTLTKLGESAFYGCTKLTDIVIPDGVANIGSYSFKACTGLSSVTLPANLKRIDESAFYGCTALRNIEIPEGTTDIDSYVFKNCTALTNVKLPQSLVQIGESAFYASKLNEVTIPDSVTTIGSYAFKNCASLAEVTLPANLSKIQESAFYGCEKLTTLEIPDKVKSIEGYAFRKCTALQSVQFPAALRQIGESAFYGCTALKQIALPEGVTSIDGYAFKSCTSLKTISLPSTLEKFGDSAFYGCTTVPEIQIPANVREIGGYAFSRCSGLKVVEFVGDAPTIGAAAFSAVTADAYYPDGNTTWTEDKQQDYGGQLTWHSSVDKLHVVAAANALPAA